MFRPAISKLFWFMFSPGTALGLLLGLVAIGCRDGALEAWRYLPKAVGAAALAGAFTSILLALLFHFLFPTRLDSEGISGFSLWGNRRFIAWQQIATARSFRMLNLRWVRLSSSADKKVTYVAQFATDPASFRAELHRLAPSDCPIFRYI